MTPGRHRPTLRLEALSWGLGLLCLAFWGLIRLQIHQAQQQFERIFDEVATTTRPTRVDAPPPFIGDPVARLEIPAIGLSAMVAEGVDESVLATAVGHLPGSALPDPGHGLAGGNVVLAAHRDSFFSRLRDIAVGDEILLADRGSSTTIYRVDDIRVLAPDRIEVMAPTPEPVVTLITCYPFEFLGPAPLRWIVRASVPRSTPEPTRSTPPEVEAAIVEIMKEAAMSRAGYGTNRGEPLPLRPSLAYSLQRSASHR